MRTYRKDPDERISIGFDWSARESVSASSWEIDVGLDAESGTFGDKYADVIVFGGTIGEQYKCTNTVESADGLIYQRSVIVQIVER